MPGTHSVVVRVRGVDIALAICEDLWQDGGPVAATRAAGAGLLLVINGSPYELNKDDVRLALCRQRAAEAGEVLQVKVRKGELYSFQGTEPLVVMGDTTRLRVRMDVDESDVGKIHREERRAH